jgi:hypothetical protein
MTSRSHESRNDFGSPSGFKVNCARWLISALVFGTAIPERCEAEPVRLELSIPPAATYVIGDPIPLLWTFRNAGNTPLAFLWEGCCRLNGQLDVSAETGGAEIIPPGPSTAHQFARAVRIDPGASRAFETFLSDWVEIAGSARYTLTGRYTGVLPEQQPQVPRSTELWRGTAESPPITVEILSTDDYLNQREKRSDERKIFLSLVGPEQFVPLQSSTWNISFRNSGSATQTISWPRDLGLWLIDPTGKRVATGSSALGSTAEEIVIDPGQVVRRKFSLSPDVLVGEPLGAYRVFVELNELAGAPRTPSNPVATSWNLEPSSVKRLIEEASAGPQVGLRNAPLKLLRTYLAEIGPDLSEVESSDLSSAARKLFGELSLASCLKSIAPKPSQVDLAVTNAISGAWAFSDRAVQKCASEEDLAEAVRSVLSVRRHLGCEFAIILEPRPLTALGEIFAFTDRLNPLETELAKPPRALVHHFDGAEAVPANVQFRTAPLPSNLILRIKKFGGRAALEAVVRRPDPGQPQRPAFFNPEEIASLVFSPQENAAALEALTAPLTAPRTLVLADPDLAWAELLDWLAPLLRRSLTMDVVRL